MSETIAVVRDTSLLRQTFRENTFISSAKAQQYINKFELSLEADLKDRESVEGNNLYVQLVAYTVIINSKKKKIFAAKRISGEKRLQNSYCIGFGGHVNDNDFNIMNRYDFNNPIDCCAHRELREELNIQNKNLDIKQLGYVRDLTSDTSEHLGIVYYLETGSASIKEKENLAGGWISFDQFKNEYYGQLESWSKAIFDYLYEDSYWSKKFMLD